MSDLTQAISSLIPDVTKLRHELHSYPELYFQEHRTAEVIAAWLERSPGIEVNRGVAETGVVGVLKGSQIQDRAIALRADMDALPIEEAGNKPYKSRNPGVMHACGHDGHMAMLAGAASVLSQMRDKLPVTVKFIFQPAEEHLAGASRMCEEGVLCNPDVAAIFGLHGWPWLEEAQVGLTPGAVMGSADQFSVKIAGSGGHAAMPHSAIDPILIAGHIIVGLQAIVSRAVDPFATAVVNVGKVQAGTASNIIPDSATLDGTIRTLSPEVRDKALRRLVQIVEQIAAAYGGTAEVQFLDRYPVLINDACLVEELGALLGDRVPELKAVGGAFPVLLAEDFAFYSEKVPSCFLALGLRPKGIRSMPLLHKQDFDFPDEALPLGIKLFTNIALNGDRFLRSLHN